MTDSEVRGSRWRVQYGEIGTRPQFRIGYVGSEAWEAYFPLSSLSDVTSVFVGAQSISPGQFFRGTNYQAEKLRDWQTTVAIQPLSYTPASALMTAYSADLAELIALLQEFAVAVVELEPEDWDNGDLDFSALDERYAHLESGVLVINGVPVGGGESGSLDGGSASSPGLESIDGGSA